jgi:ankyrin repeat protein
MKPISTKKNEAETITIFNVIIANSVERFQKQLLQGANINDRDEQNQTPLHYTAIHCKFENHLLYSTRTLADDARKARCSD